jgi:transposase
MEKITLIGVDLAKKVFHLTLRNEAGKTVEQKRLKRHEMLPFFATQPRCVVAMESCGGSG